MLGCGVTSPAARSRFRGVAGRLDGVAVQVGDEGGVVVRVILWPQARRAIAGAAGGVEGAHLRAVSRGEGQVDMPRRRAEGAESEGHRPATAHAGPALAVLQHRDAERRQRRDVEAAAAREIGHGEADVIENPAEPPRSGGGCYPVAVRA